MTSAPKPYELKWGILSTGWIATHFAKDSLVDPATRNVSDVSHRVVAIASRSQDGADKFAEKWFPGDKRVKRYASYTEFLADPGITAVYLASPNTLHFSHTKMCIEAGKHVLLEKPATINAAQARFLFGLAKKHNVFLMEAAWTYFLPVAIDVRKIIASGVLGDIRHVHSSFSHDVGVETLPDSDRFINASVGGGSLLDMGPYSWTWLSLTIGESRKSLEPPTGDLPVPKIQSHVTRLQLADPSRPGNGTVDETVIASMVFPALTPTTSPATATFHTSIVTTAMTGAPACYVQGSRGKMTLDWPAPQPAKLTLETHDVERVPTQVPLVKSDVKTEVRTYVNGPGGARGFVFEMDEVARCVRDGKIESDILPGRATILAMEVFDEIRRQNNLVYTPELEACE